MLFLLFYFINLNVIKVIDKKNTLYCYNGYDMRENIKNDSDVIIYIHEMLYKKKLLDNLMSKSMSIDQKINLIELNNDKKLITNILNGNLLDEWYFDF